MAISSPVTPGQVSFLLGVVPIIAAWIYSEFLEYKKNSNFSKARHSDINLVEVGNDVIKEDDKAVLLEGGGLHSASPRARSSSATTPLIRFLLMDESFLIENRLTLRAIAELSALLAYFYICDRTDVFNSSQKSYNRDLFLFLYFLLIIVSAITSFKIHTDKSSFSGKSILYLNRHQTEEWKGWMQVLFLMYHYFAATEIYNAIRLFIAAYVWMTGFGNFSYYYIRKDFSLARFAQMMWRLNFFVIFCCIVLNNSYMLYYICPFDPAHPYKDPVAMLEMREHLVREKWIDIEKAKILREKLRWCYRIEGVNHYQKCRHLVEQYLDSTRGIGWGKDGRHPSLHGPKPQPAESE